MLGSENDGKKIRAIHGRWINELQESIDLMDRRLTLLERKVSAWESQLAERARAQRELDAEFSSIRAKLRGLGSK